MVFLVLRQGKGLSGGLGRPRCAQEYGRRAWGGTGNYIPKPPGGPLWGFGNVNAMNTTFSAYTSVITVTAAPSIGTTRHRNHK